MTEIIPDVLIERPVIFQAVIGVNQSRPVFQGKCFDAIPNLHIRDRDRLSE